LRQAGLSRHDRRRYDCPPGAGEIGPHDPAQRRRLRAHQDAIVRVAITMADAEGLAALSMRRFAAVLGSA